MMLENEAGIVNVCALARPGRGRKQRQQRDGRPAGSPGGMANVKMALD